MSVLEPFGYFRSTPFGWEDCAENAEGAKPLYEISAEDALAALGWYARMEKAEARVLELEQRFAEAESLLKQLHAANMANVEKELDHAFDALMIYMHTGK